MRPAAILALLLAAHGARAAESVPTVIACDSLVGLRRLMAEGEAGRERLSAFPGCRAVTRAGLGTVERRAMIGGAPFECFAVEGGACLWVMP